MDRGAWRTIVRGVTKSWTQLKRLSMQATQACQVCLPRGRPSHSSPLADKLAGHPPCLGCLVRTCQRRSTQVAALPLGSHALAFPPESSTSLWILLASVQAAVSTDQNCQMRQNHIRTWEIISIRDN